MLPKRLSAIPTAIAQVVVYPAGARKDSITYSSIPGICLCRSRIRKWCHHRSIYPTKLTLKTATGKSICKLGGREIRFFNQGLELQSIASRSRIRGNRDASTLPPLRHTVYPALNLPFTQVEKQRKPQRNANCQAGQDRRPEMPHAAPATLRRHKRPEYGRGDEDIQAEEGAHAISEQLA